MASKRLRNSGVNIRLTASSLASSRLMSPKPMPSRAMRSEEHTSELQSLMRNSYAVFCLKKKNKANNDAQCNSTCVTSHILIERDLIHIYAQHPRSHIILQLVH